MDTTAQLIAAIGALGGVIVTIAKLYDAARERAIVEARADRDKCCAERDTLRSEAAAMLRDYQERDAEDLRAWRAGRGAGREATP